MADTQTLPSPVATEALRAKFENFDDRAVYDKVKEHGLNQSAKNVVVRFGAQKAEVALDLDAIEFDALLKRDHKDEETPIRYINIWNPSRQRDTIECIGRKYGFSGRLILSIREWDDMRAPAQDQRTLKAANTAKTHVDAKSSRDVEKEANGQPGVTDPDIQALFDPENVATFRLMQDSMNYTSFDLEKRFVCVGANWLHNRPKPEQPVHDSLDKTSLVPPKHWSWFVLCNDNTVISFHEAACYEGAKRIPHGENQVRWQREELKNMRANTLKVLRQLSKCGLKEDKHKIMHLTAVRHPLMVQRPGQTAIPTNLHAIEGSSNLFYYLFEDYSGAVAILSKSKVVLGDLGTRVLKTAQWKHKEDTSDIIPSLYKLNKELRQLQHLFTNYKTVIERILADREPPDDHYNHGQHHIMNSDKLSKKARDRFERLRDQLQALMLDTIQDYLDEKESLQQTYFNLTQQKDSQATARLTRSATTLAKLSVLFLPISFMTSYFSVQIPEVTEGYNTRTYWGAFGVVFSLSLIGLLFFGKVLVWISDRLQHYSDNLTRQVRDTIARRGVPATDDTDVVLARNP